MARRAITLQHAVAVAKDANAVMAIEAAAFGVSDAFVGFQRGLFSARRQLNAAIRIQLFRME